MEKFKKLLYIAFAVLILAVIFGSSAVRLITDWWWFQGLDLPGLFVNVLQAKILVGVGAALATFAFLFGNLALAQKLTKSKRFSISLSEEKEEIVSREGSLYPFTITVSAILSIFIGLGLAESWQVFLKFFNQVPFGDTAPILGQNIAYYVFTLPFLNVAFGWAFMVVVFSLLGAGLIYFARQVFEIKALPPSITQKGAKIHIFLLVAVFFVLVAAQTHFIKIPGLLQSQEGVVYGAGYTDIHAKLPYFRVLSFLALAVGAFALFNTIKRNSKLIWTGIALYILVIVAGGWIYPAVVQNFVVSPNELTKETPYIENNIIYTRKAYNLDDVSEKTLGKDVEAEEKTLSQSDIQANQPTVQNIRLWDREPLLDTLGQLQEIRTYYRFGSVDNDRYTLDGNYRQIMISPRELDTSKLPQQSFINKHLIYTHGYGVTAAPVNEVTAEGLPKLFVKDFPPSSIKARLNVKRPQIYYGEQSNTYAIANTKMEEFDYPSGEKNIYTSYEGSGGVQIDSLAKKTLLALRFSTAKVFLSGNITSKSRALFDRNIYKRARKAYGFLEFDKDPYIVITDDGKLKWIMDAYTTSRNYPYSRPADRRGTNYIRNSVKVVVDAYTGKMDAYITDPDDPIIQTYKKIFPNAFKSFDQISEDIRAHIRYPETLFSIQTALYSTYHMEDPKVFYNQEDQWEIPRFLSSREKKEEPMMRHIIMKLPGEKEAEFIFMVPFTPRGKDNMAAWMAARSDGENYGELVVYRFPKKRLVYGPKQLSNRIDQNTGISEQVSLWDQKGSEVIRGNLLVIPIEESLVYVQPLYLRGSGGNIPELKRVIVAVGDDIVMEPKLDQALARIFGAASRQDTSGRQEPSKLPANIQSLIDQAQNHFQNALEAQRQGDWSSYGNEINSLGSVLEEIRNE